MCVLAYFVHMFASPKYVQFKAQLFNERRKKLKDEAQKIKKKLG